MWTDGNSFIRRLVVHNINTTLPKRAVIRCYIRGREETVQILEKDGKSKGVKESYSKKKQSVFHVAPIGTVGDVF